MLAPTIPFGEQLAIVHVPFDDLVGERAHESRVRHVAEAGGLALVVGNTGEGKADSSRPRSRFTTAGSPSPSPHLFRTPTAYLPTTCRVSS
jgi:hypothetical protein